jgi:hypothetical protein
MRLLFFIKNYPRVFENRKLLDINKMVTKKYFHAFETQHFFLLQCNEVQTNSLGHDCNLIFSQKCHVAIRLRESRQLQWQRGLLWRYREVRSNLFKRSCWQTVESDPILYAQWITVRPWVQFFIKMKQIFKLVYLLKTDFTFSSKLNICFRSPIWSIVPLRSS